MAIDYTDKRFKFRKSGKTPSKARATRNRAGRAVAADDREDVYRRQHYVCFAQGVSKVCTGQCHHPHELIPVSRGGPRKSWNRVGICWPCHAATDSTLGGRRLYFTWPGKAERKPPDANQPGQVTCYWRERKTR